MCRPLSPNSARVCSDLHGKRLVVELLEIVTVLIATVVDLLIPSSDQHKRVGMPVRQHRLAVQHGRTKKSHFRRGREE
jgi:hypothetical protein